MAKRKSKVSVPSTVESGSEVRVPASEQIEPAVCQEVKQATDAVSVRLPIGEVGNGYCGSNRVDVQRMTPVQKKTLRKILRGLENEGARMNDGRLVRNAQDVFKYILDRVG